MDELVEVINTLLALVPEKHRAWVEALMALAWALGVALAAAKPLVARLVTTPQARAWWDAGFRILDLIAANSRGLHTRPTAAAKEKRR